MDLIQTITSKIITLEEAVRMTKVYQLRSEKVVFTNGCFDIVHLGHIQLIIEAHSKGDRLILGLNSDASVKRLKGESRPVQDEFSRAMVLAAMALVDNVVIFEEDTPLELITAILPDVLVKGGDYTIDTIVGAKEVIANGGTVEIVNLKEGYSTSNVIARRKK